MKDKTMKHSHMFPVRHAVLFQACRQGQLHKMVLCIGKEIKMVSSNFIDLEKVLIFA
jgi:hypothetical protein